MILDFAFHCEYAHLTDNDLTAVGIGRRTIEASELPHEMPTFCVVVRVRFEEEEDIQPNLKVELFDPTGEVIRESEDSGPPLSGIETATVVFGFARARFEHHGPYLVRISGHGNVLKEFDFFVDATEAENPDPAD